MLSLTGHASPYKAHCSAVIRLVFFSLLFHKFCPYYQFLVISNGCCDLKLRFVLKQKDRNVYHKMCNINNNIIINVTHFVIILNY